MDRGYDNNVEHYRRLSEAKLKGDAVQQRWQEEKKERLAAVLIKKPTGFHPPNQYPQDTDFEHKKNEVATKVKVAKILIDIFSSAEKEEKEDGINRRHFEHNGIKYYFINHIGEYADSAYSETKSSFEYIRNHFTEGLDYFYDFDMSEYKEDKDKDIYWYDYLLRTYSPAQLGQNKSLTLYNAVLNDVLIASGIQQPQHITGGKRKTKGKSKKVAKKPVVSQKKQSIYKEILGKQMKIYKMPDSRKEYVKYKGDLLHISDYKDLMKQKALAKSKPKAKSKK